MKLFDLGWLYRNSWNLEPIPYAPCMVYLPTLLGDLCWAHVGKYSVHGAYGHGGNPQWRKKMCRMMFLFALSNQKESKWQYIHIYIHPLVNEDRPWQIEVGRLVSIKTRLCSGSMLIYQRVYTLIYLITTDAICATNIDPDYFHQKVQGGAP
jgi:hypothetical protein